MSKEIYKGLIRPFLDTRDSETWHIRAREALHLAEASPFTLKLLEQFAYKRSRFNSENLKVVLGGIEFDNPVIVGAGWDKAGRAVKALYTLGFSGVEVGSVLADPQPGNDKPRQFMLDSGVALNRLGFNSPGMEVVARNLEKYKDSGIPIGISLGKNKKVDAKDAPYAHAVVAERLYEHASYFVINVSSPNTPGLRSLQDKSPLNDIAQAVNSAMDRQGGRKPTFVKIAPDLTNDAVNDVIEVIADNNLTGIIATNTTIKPDLKAKYGEEWRDAPGGLSGDDEEFRTMATEKISHIYRETGGTMEIIGIGGVNDFKSALEKIQAGARVVQIVTGIRGEGTTLPGRINRELDRWMRARDIRSISEVVGSNS